MIVVDQGTHDQITETTFAMSLEFGCGNNQSEKEDGGTLGGGRGGEECHHAVNPS